jgi:zinc transport system permease protein
MEIILDAFEFGFFQRAFLAGIALSMVYALLGNYVVLRNEAIIGHAISHIVFLGIALATLLAWNLTLTMILVSLIGVIAIDLLQRYTSISPDSLLAFISQIAIAAAIVTLSQVEGYQNIQGFLFGSILAVSNLDVWLTVGLLMATAITMILIRKPLTQLVINPELAISAGTPIRRTNFIFLLLLALTIALGIKIIGVILLAAFLIIPSNTAKNIARNFRQMVLISLTVSIIGVSIGLLLSYILDVPSGAMIVLILGILLIFSNLFKLKSKQAN